MLKTSLPTGCKALAPALTRALARTLALALALFSTTATAAAQVKTETVARGLVNPWALAFLPDGRMLVTERPGRLRLLGADGQPGAALAGLPAVDAGGQCGLLDVVVDPQFAQNQTLYWTYAEAGNDTTGGTGTNGVAVARGRLQGQQLQDVKVIFRQSPKVRSNLHCGSRLVFTREGHLMLGLGDRYSRKDDAQTTDNHLGKVVRITTSGSVPAGNPFLGQAGALPELWSLGHRNIQGAALHPTTGEVWMVEHGPQGGDEVNVVEAGRNYGWPLLTYGRNYGTGTRIGDEGPKPGFTQPLKWWVPSIATSGLAFVTSDRYPGWKGQLLVGALRGQALVRLTLQGRQVVAEERVLQDLGERVRDVRQGPDGYLYIVTDSSDGKVLRLLP